MAKNKIIPSEEVVSTELLSHDETKSLRVEALNESYVVMFGDSYISKSGHICELAIDAHFYPTKIKAQQAVDFITANLDFLKF